MLKEKGEREAGTQSAYHSDYKWFEAWFAWQTTHTHRV